VAALRLDQRQTLSASWLLRLVRAANHAVAVQSWLSGHVHLFGGHPPGPGAHGMCGANAAQSALDELSQR
jgi:hypothetical protein